MIDVFRFLRLIEELNTALQSLYLSRDIKGSSRLTGIVQRDSRVSVPLNVIVKTAMVEWKMIKEVDSNSRKLHNERCDKASKSARTT
jgi:hypothetical protein